MKQWFRTVFAGALLAGLLAVSAAAADYTACADHLKDLGLLQGTEQGYELDFNRQRLHHEIYLSDTRKVAPEKLKTVIRHPIRKV